MQIENRPGTTNTYVVSTFRRDGKLRKRYIGKASDSVVHLFVEYERLAKANEHAYREACSLEQDNDIAASKSLDWLCRWSAGWKVISKINELEMSSKPTSATASERELPGLHRINRICSLAQEGDPDAQRQLDIWIAETPEVLSVATDLMGLTREYLVQFVSSAAPENSMLWQKQIDEKSAQLCADLPDDPLSDMYAELTTLAWLDVMRSSLMPYVAGGDVTRSSYWGSELGRSQRRWTKISTAFQQHRKTRCVTRR
ncbi:hypothetical protein [Allorhodopirellula solitaria]|uniref:Uncharacterized protein n=1 Tax=Allorhodopirellula solitaria TaxID=2527987 RepID=A0A5C5X0L1_9BACT|nr:hypothetical protein [Allorhodopirellula solitaria]TWT56527.1 hypothetical protein CA85_40600 [Allorhodopirellula solitaria]